MMKDRKPWSFDHRLSSDEERKGYEKRILSAVVVLVLFAGVLAGCISGNGTQDAKLNIIDDNYRNYYEIFVGSFMTVMGTAWVI